MNNGEKVFSTLRRVLMTSLWVVCLTAQFTLKADEVQDRELFSAAAAGKTERVRMLLGQGADVNATSAGGRTALMGAAFNGNLRVVRSLLAFGASVDATDSRGVSALMDASMMGHEQIVKLLLSMGTDVNKKDNSGQSALAKAKMNEKKSVEALLVSAGAIDEGGGDETAPDGEPAPAAAVE